MRFTPCRLSAHKFSQKKVPNYLFIFKNSPIFAVDFTKRHVSGSRIGK